MRRDGQVPLRWPLPDGSPTQPIPVDLFLPQDVFHEVVAVPLLDVVVPILSATDLTTFQA